MGFFLKKGEIPNSEKILGTSITIYEKDDELTNEIKKTGLFSDLEDKLELRVGDTLIFYLSRGDWFFFF